MEKKEQGFSWRDLVGYIIVAIAVIIGGIVLLAVVKFLFLLSLYKSYVGFFSGTFGLDYVLARALAVFAAAGTIVVIPWVLSFFLLGRRKLEVVIVGSFVIAALTMGMYFGTEDVFFDRTSGKPLKYYIKTLDGFKFSSQEDFDPMFGVKYRVIDGNAIKEYYFWKDHGRHESVPKVVPGEYFDRLTGEPIVWYSVRPDGSITLFPLPGFDPLTGRQLSPMQNDVVIKHGNRLMIWESKVSGGRRQIAASTAASFSDEKKTAVIIVLIAGAIVFFAFFRLRARAHVKIHGVKVAPKGKSGREKFINELRRKKRFDVKWYLNEPMFTPVKSSACWFESYNVQVEKIAQAGSWVVIGVGINSTSQSSTTFEWVRYSCRVMNKYNLVHSVESVINDCSFPPWILPDKIGLLAGEKKKILLLVESAHLDDFKEGKIIEYGGDSISFKI